MDSTQDELPTGSDNPHESPIDPQVGTPLSRDRSFIGITATQFLGAFNDNLFKQTILLMFVAVPWGNGTRDLQAVATFCFAAPFILLSGWAGYLSDRHSKRRVIVFSKVAEIVIMTIGIGLFAMYSASGLSVGLVVLLSATVFLMGSQSAFFGPGKYGILPELLEERDLPPANGIVLMTTFMAIIFGSALAGLLLESFADSLWIVGVACVLVAVIGTGTSLLIRPTPLANPELKFKVDALAVPGDMRRLLRADNALLQAVIASTIFWLAAAMVQMSVNKLGKVQLDVGEFRTSLLISMISIGIAVGSVIAGQTSKHRFHTGVLRIGCWGMIVCLALLVPVGVGRPHLLGYYGSMAALIALGAFTGMFAVPLQVFMQSRPPAKLKGRMIATQNLLNWIGITASAGIYAGTNILLSRFSWPPSIGFAVPALLLLGVALLYHPSDQPLTSKHIEH